MVKQNAGCIGGLGQMDRHTVSKKSCHHCIFSPLYSSNQEVQITNSFLGLPYRYPFYMLSCINIEWKILTWIRYSIWIPLYPLGLLAEGTMRDRASAGF